MEKGNGVLRQNVPDELEFEASVNAAHIGVTAENGIVTLSGHVSSYAEKVAAERAAQRVKGVCGIAQEIDVRYADRFKRTMILQAVQLIAFAGIR